MANKVSESKELLEKYGTTTNPDFIKELTKIYNINSKYQLSPSTEKDFNNSVKFLKYSITKDSKKIDENETDLSSLFGKFLLKYYNTTVSNQDTAKILDQLFDYNSQIENQYKKDFFDENNEIKWKNYVKILENIYGINTANLSLKKDSVAEKIFNIFDSETASDNGMIRKINFNNNNKTKTNIISFLTLYNILYYITKTDETPNVDKLLNIFPNENGDNFQIIVNKNNIINEQSTINGESYNIKTRQLVALLKNNFNDKQYEISVGNSSDIYLPLNSDMEVGQVVNSSINIQFEDPINNNASNSGITTKLFDVVTENKSITKTSKSVYNLNIEKLVEILNKNDYYLKAKENIKTIYVEIPANSGFDITSMSNTKNEIVNIDGKSYLKVKFNYNTVKVSKTSDPTHPETEYNFINFFEDKAQQAQKDYLIQNIDTIIDAEYNIMLNTFKVYTEFGQTTTSAENIESINNQIKNSANAIETYYALSYTNMNLITLRLYVKKNSDLMNILKKFKNNINTNTDSLFYIGIIYKEFNTHIREIDMSYIQNRIIGEYISSKSNSLGNILNEKFYSILENESLGRNVFSTKERQLFNETHTNDFIIRNYVVNDIISYIAGESIDFGISRSDKDDIQNILKIYKDCREYFYKVLYNKSFTLDYIYNIYIVLILKSQTIERFMSSRLDNFLNIDKYNEDECRNFLISYGLKSLSDQVDNNDFINSLEYKKRVIADYNEIMSKKGSKSVIDEFLKIFNYGSNEIEIYKYLLFKVKNDSTNTNSINFLSVPYYSKNILYNIQKSVEKNTILPYNTFIENDKYWKNSDLPEDKLIPLISSPVNTKYLGIDLKKDLFYNIISSKYVLSLNDYLYNNLFVDNQNIYSYKNFRFTISDLATIDNDSEFDFLFLYNNIRVLFSILIYFTELQMNDPFNSTQSKKKYLGINPKANIAELRLPEIKNLFRTKYIKFDTESNKLLINKDTSIEYYLYYQNKIKPFKLDQDTFEITDIALDLPNLEKDIALLPINTDHQPFNTSKYDLFDYANKDIHSSTLSKKSISSTDILNVSFQSINLINLLNQTSNIDEKTKYTEMIYTFNKYKSDGKYPDSLSQFPLLNSQNINDALTMQNFYKYLYEDILKFPINYLLGIFDTLPNTNYTAYERNIHTKIFNEFFLTDESVIPVLNKENSNEYLNNIINNNIHSYHTGKSDTEKWTNYKKMLETIFNGILPSDNIQLLTSPNNKIEIILYSDSILITTSIIENINKKIIEYINLLNSFVEGFNDMKINIDTTDSINNFFDFVVTSVSFFISYTALLYKTNLVMSIDTKSEKVPVVDEISDEIIHIISEYAYYDESIDIHVNPIEPMEVKSNEK